MVRNIKLLISLDTALRLLGNIESGQYTKIEISRVAKVFCAAVSIIVWGYCPCVRNGSFKYG